MKFLGQIFQFLYAGRSSCDLIIFITFQISLQDILGDYENSEHQPKIAAFAILLD